MDLSQLIVLVVVLSIVSTTTPFGFNIGRHLTREHRNKFYNVPSFTNSGENPHIQSKQTKNFAVTIDRGDVASSSSRHSDSGSSNGKGTSRMKMGVLLLNLGGPETIKDVEGFLYNLFADPDIIRLPPYLSFMQKPLAYTIAKGRAPKSSVAYESIGGGSPIVKYTQEQADLIKASIESKLESEMGDIDTDVKCYFAMRYWNPYTEEVLDQITTDEIDSLVIVPLYPQYSISTSGSSLKLLQEIFYKNPEKWNSDQIMHTVVPSWYHRPGYITAMASLVVQEVLGYSLEEMRDGVHVLFSAHGVPESYIASGDPYQQQIEECVRLISREVAEQLKQAGNDKDVNGKVTGEDGQLTFTKDTLDQLAGDGSAPAGHFSPNPSSIFPVVDTSAADGVQAALAPILQWNDDKSAAVWVQPDVTTDGAAGVATTTVEETETEVETEVDSVAVAAHAVKSVLEWNADGTVATWDPSAPTVSTGLEGVASSSADSADIGVMGVVDMANETPVDQPVKEVQYHLSFQSKVGPVQWLQPYTEEMIVQLANPYGETRARNLIVVPVSFVSEHIETLEEIDMEYRELAEESGVLHWKRAPALNTDGIFIEDMADMVLEALRSPALSVSEAAARHSDVIESYGGAGTREGESGTGGLGKSSDILSPSAEVVNGRFAMLGIVGTTLLELANGHPVLQMIK